MTATTAPEYLAESCLIATGYNVAAALKMLAAEIRTALAAGRVELAAWHYGAATYLVTVEG